LAQTPFHQLHRGNDAVISSVSHLFNQTLDGFGHMAASDGQKLGTLFGKARRIAALAFDEWPARPARLTLWLGCTHADLSHSLTPHPHQRLPQTSHSSPSQMGHRCRSGSINATPMAS